MNNQIGQNTEHVQEDTPACMRTYGYMYNIIFILLTLWYRQEHICVGFLLYAD